MPGLINATLCRTIDNNCQLFVMHGRKLSRAKPQAKKTRQLSGFFPGETSWFSSNVHSPLFATILPTPVSILTTFACSPSSIFPCIDPKSMDLTPSVTVVGFSPSVAVGLYSLFSQAVNNFLVHNTYVLERRWIHKEHICPLIMQLSSHIYPGHD